MALFSNIVRATAVLALVLQCSVSPANERSPGPIKVAIAAQPLEQALNDWASQTGYQVLVDAQGDLARLMAPKVAGSLTPEAALRLLLAQTGLIYKFTDARTVTIQAATASSSRISTGTASGALRMTQGEGMASPEAPPAATSSDIVEDRTDKLTEVTVSLPEVLVKGSRLLNTDIPRTRDDAQPYVIFDRQAIERSAATDLEGFLQQRLAMNSTVFTSDKFPTSSGVNSQIDLRGLGTNQTLILVDGHRVTSSAFIAGSAFNSQPDLNGIPLSAIQRIEVLPTTASGIYGGGATGGVVNIVLRRDFSGSEVRATFDDTFEGGGAARRIDMSTGFGTQSGKTRVFLAGSYSDSDPLTAGERDFVERGRVAAYRNNPDVFLGPFTPPPLGATANIASAFDFFTFEQPALVLKNGTPLNSTLTSAPIGYDNAGSGSELLTNAGRYNLQLADVADFNGGRRGAILGNPTRKSITGTWRQELTPKVQTFLELSASQNISQYQSGSSSGVFFLPSAAPNNPFLQDILVTIPFVGNPTTNIETRATDRRAVGGLIVGLPYEWTGDLDYTWNRWYRSPSSASPFVETFGLGGVVATGSPDILRDPERFPLDTIGFFNPPSRYSSVETTLKDTSLRFAGPLAHLAGGALNLSFLLEHREESLGDQRTVNSSPFGISSIVSPSKDQSVDSLYLETHVPLISDRNARPWARELEITVAGRYDRYRVNGADAIVQFVDGDPPPVISRVRNETTSTNPTVGLRFRPISDLTLRASYGTGFLPPSVIQLVSEADTIIPPGFSSGLVDPRRGDTAIVGPLVLSTGGQANLRPEESESWSLGTIVTPQILPGMRFSLDYTRIEKTDNIAGLTAQQLLNNEDILNGRVVRDVNQPGDLPGWEGPITRLDMTLVNIARSKIEAYDLQADWETPIRSWGSLAFYLLGTWQTHFQTQLTPDADVVENVGVFTSFNVVKFKGTTGITATRGAWRLGWDARYLDSYLVADPSQDGSAPLILSQGNGGRVPSQMYHDAFLSWTSPSSARDTVFSDLEVKIGIRNVFDKVPPFDASNNTYFYSFWGDPRLRGYSLSLKKSFNSR